MGRIDTLLAAMTTEEKIGQLNMVAASQAVTGPGELRDVHEGCEPGRFENYVGQSADLAELLTAVIELGRRPEPAQPGRWGCATASDGGAGRKRLP